MTVNVESPDTIYVPTGAAVGPFATVWSYADASDVKVLIETDGVELALSAGSDYTLLSTAREQGGYTGGVTLTAAPAGGWLSGKHRLIVRRETALEQTKPFGQVDGFRPKVSEEAWDRGARMAQEARQRLGRAILTPSGETPLQLPSRASRANRVWGGDALGDFATFEPASAVTAAENVTLAERGGFSATIGGVLERETSIMEWIPPQHREAIMARTISDAVDLGPYIDAAQAAVSAQGGGTIRWPAGVYPVGTPWNIRFGVKNAATAHVPVGVGARGTTIRPTQSMAAVITQQSLAGPVHSAAFEGFTFDGRRRDGIEIAIFMHVSTIEFDLTRCSFEDGFGEHLRLAANPLAAWINRIQDNTFGGANGTCVFFGGSDSIISGNYFSNGYNCLWLQGTGNVRVIGNHFELADAFGIMEESGSFSPQVGNVFAGNTFAENARDVWIKKGASFGSIAYSSTWSGNRSQSCFGTPFLIDANMLGGEISDHSFNDTAAGAYGVEFAGAPPATGWTLGLLGWDKPLANRVLNAPEDLVNNSAPSVYVGRDGAFAVNAFFESGEGTAFRAMRRWVIADPGAHLGSTFYGFHIEMRPTGSTGAGPTEGDYNLSLSNIKKDWLNSTVAGETGAISAAVRQGKGDTSIILGNIGVRDGFGCFGETITTQFAAGTGAILRQVNTQIGALDTVSGVSAGFIAQAITGAHTYGVFVQALGAASFQYPLYLRGATDLTYIVRNDNVHSYPPAGNAGSFANLVEFQNNAGSARWTNASGALMMTTSQAGQLTTNGGIIAGGPVRLRSYTFATLPTPTNGDMVHCSNSRNYDAANVLEGAGAGTGGQLVGNNSAWKIPGRNVTASA